MTRLQDDFYDAINGEWAKTAVIPDDKPVTGGFMDLAEEIEDLMLSTTDKWLAGDGVPAVSYTHLDVYKRQDLGHPLFGAEMKKAQVLEDGYIAVKDGKILALGSGEPDASLIGPDTKIQSYEGKIATPGLIDCHTHLVYGGSLSLIHISNWK